MITRTEAVQAYEALWNRLNKNHKLNLLDQKENLDTFFYQLQDIVEDTGEPEWLAD